MKVLQQSWKLDFFVLEMLYPVVLYSIRRQTFRKVTVLLFSKIPSLRQRLARQVTVYAVEKKASTKMQLSGTEENSASLITVTTRFQRLLICRIVQPTEPEISKHRWRSQSKTVRSEHFLQHLRWDLPPILFYLCIAAMILFLMQ